MEKRENSKGIESLASEIGGSEINPLDLAKAWADGNTDYSECLSFGKARCYCPKNLTEGSCEHAQLCHDYNLAHILFHSGVTLLD